MVEGSRLPVAATFLVCEGCLTFHVPMHAWVVNASGWLELLPSCLFYILPIYCHSTSKDSISFISMDKSDRSWLNIDSESNSCSFVSCASFFS